MPRKKKAVALKYNLEQDMAPVVIASGYGEVAERIINIAEERGIPVYRDDSAASMLCMLEVGAMIPEELYQVVATIYIQIMETANRIKEGSTIGAPVSRASLPGGDHQRTNGGITVPQAALPGVVNVSIGAGAEAGAGVGTGTGDVTGAGSGTGDANDAGMEKDKDKATDRDTIENERDPDAAGSAAGSDSDERI